MALKRKRGRGERRSKGRQKERDDHFSSERKERREVKRRIQQGEEAILEEKYAVINTGDELKLKQSIFEQMEYILSTIRISAVAGRNRNKPNASFSKCIGYTANTFGLNGFKTPHNLKERKHLGIYVFSPENHRVPWWLLEMWNLSKLLIPLYDKSWGEGMFMFSFSSIC